MNIAELGTAELEAELVGLAGHLAAAQCRFLLLLAEFDARVAWSGPGLRSCAHWLSWRIGMDLRTAREQLRVAPQTEADLLEVALAGTASHLERVVRLARSAGAGAAAAVVARRSVSWDWAEDGSLLLRARLPGEQGALVLAALEMFLEEPQADAGTAPASEERSSPQESSAEQPAPGPDWETAQAEQVAAASEQAPGAVLDRTAARRADALVALAEAARDRGIGNRALPVNAPFEVMVHVHADSGTAEIEGGSALPISTAQRLACETRVSALIKDRRGNPLYLGRRRRLVSPRLLRALRARDRGQCRFPGCTNKHVEAHHIVAWLVGGRTDITNLVLVCGFHHRLIHDHGYQICWADGDLEFRRPDGTPIPKAAPPVTGKVEHLVEMHAAEQLEITEDSLTPTWSGEALDPDPILLRLLAEPAPAAAA